MGKEDYSVFDKWTKILDWVLSTVEKFPKSARFSLASRIANISLDVMEEVIEAIYTKNRVHVLISINLYLEKLRVLFRISFNRRYISSRQFEFISYELIEFGKMIGGWKKIEARKRSISRGC